MNKILIGLLAVLSATSVLLFAAPKSELQMNNTYDLFAQWKIQHNKFYSATENQYRLKVFTENYNYVQQFNKNSDNLKLGMNIFAALTNAEYQQLMLTELTETTVSDSQVKRLPTNDVPSSVNWIEKGAVTDVKNQGVCGGCWSFAVTAGLEGARAIFEGNLESLSPQQLLSCMTAPAGHGCNGGNHVNAYDYTQQNGIETWASYPYVQENDPVTAPCNYDASKVVFKNKGHFVVPKNDPEQMKVAIAQQPASIRIAASSIVFQLYSGGVLDSEACGVQLNHEVAIVGYDAEGAQPYWLIKNSWGTDWGLQGYVKIIISNGDGICGININPVYPTA